jgi:predicted N-acetyltransferase YhbS
MKDSIVANYLVGFLAGELIGTIVLREIVVETHPEYHPGLGGLFVVKPHRRCGIGTDLVQQEFR